MRIYVCEKKSQNIVVKEKNVPKKSSQKIHFIQFVFV